jgi:hypothetical protein
MTESDMMDQHMILGRCGSYYAAGGSWFSHYDECDDDLPGRLFRYPLRLMHSTILRMNDNVIMMMTTTITCFLLTNHTNPCQQDELKQP